MRIRFAKYHALLNDFMVVDGRKHKIGASRRARFVKTICNRKSGIGADGVLFIGDSAKGTAKVDVYNADGGWAEKSGNGLRIAGLHSYRTKSKTKTSIFEMGGTLNSVAFVSGNSSRGLLRVELGIPQFHSQDVPVRAKSKYMINAPLKIGGVNIPVTCLSIGNPHTVLFVDNFNFDWKTLGTEIEKHKAFPNGTNVEFVKILSKNRLRLAEWERGVGATGSSGTGAAAAVTAAVILGLTNRKCLVEFESGSVNVNWRKRDNVIELTGPVESICKGIFEYI